MGQKRKRTPEKMKPVEEPKAKKVKWTNKERVLIFSSRGISHQNRHLMNDFRTMMPHSKSDTKMDRKDQLFVINEICEMKNCRKVMFFEAKKKMDLYMWLANSPKGPSVKFLVENVHTMSELKMTGNCLKGSRPLLSFDKEFDAEPHWLLLKELFIQTFSTPNYHPKSQPFVDHVFTFSIADNRVWFRNYQILEENGELAEIGPRMVLNPIRIFKGSFAGETLYQNPHYVSPNQHRSMIRKAASNRYVNKVSAQKSRDERKPEYTFASDPTDIVFETA
jgi:ribosome biogenesis protein BRX1